MIRLLMASVVLVAVTRVAAAPMVLYVAPDGNDGWSGNLVEANEAGTDGPLATIQGARDAIRRLRGDGPRWGNITVLIRGGTYFMSAPLVLRPEDSGTPTGPVAYAAYPGERVVLSGGFVIGGWRQGAGGVWTADVPGVAEGDLYFHQLFVNGVRRTRARTPNEGYFTIVSKAPPEVALDLDTETSRDNTAFIFDGDDIKPWADLDGINVVVFHSWETSRLRIAEVDEDERTVTFTGRAAWPFERWGPGQRYFVENAPDALDAPGEWYLDRASGTLSYIPMPGEDMEQAEVIAPRLTSLVELRGQTELGLPVEWVHFRGLSFQHQDWSLAPEGHSDNQAAVTVPAAIMADGAAYCGFERCEIAHVGGYGIWLRRGCKNNRIAMSRIHDLGAGGARVGEARMAADDAAEATGNRVDNNHVYDGGHVYPAGVGVWVAQSSHNIISHNEIHDFNYSGMSIGWNWNDAPNRTHHNTIEFNHVHHVMGKMLNDGGAIYTLGTSPGSVIRNNIFHDVWPYSAIGWGIYLDATTNQYLVENNIVYNTLSGGLMKHNGGHENVIQNNVFAFSAQQMLWPCWAEQERANHFRRNIVYLTQGDLFIPMAERRLKARLEAGEWLGDWDHNCYWNPNDPDMRFFRHDFAEWQALGLDQHSVIADPGFADAEAYDFTLKEDSPALKLGFQPIDASAVGLYGDAEWVAEARRVEHARTALPPPAPARKAAPVDDDFEDAIVGTSPRWAVVSGEEKGASIRVSDERAAAGRHSLKLTDLPGLSQIWQPHMYYRPYVLKGTVRQSFDVWLAPDALVFTEWRDSGPYPANIGPSVSFAGDGRVSAGGDHLMDIPLEEWVHVDIECELGRDAPGTYTVTITLQGKAPEAFADIPFTGTEFRELHWLGFVSNADTEAVCYLDNISIQPGGP